MPYKMDVALSVVRRIGRSIEPNFMLSPDNEQVFRKLIQWFHADPDFKGWLDKGIMLMGPTGCGKTLAMNIMLRYRDIDNVMYVLNGKWHRLFYRIADVNEIIRAFVNNAYDGINMYTNANVLCIDDLGYEAGMAKRFGNIEDVVSFIVGERYSKKLLTLATTNLWIEKLQEKYDDRTYSRICGMFNFITMKGADYRKEGGV